jgi:hypothetical protein
MSTVNLLRIQLNTEHISRVRWTRFYLRIMGMCTTFNVDSAWWLMSVLSVLCVVDTCYSNYKHFSKLLIDDYGHDYTIAWECFQFLIGVIIASVIVVLNYIIMFG